MATGAATTAWTIGEKIGRYELLGRVGAGGMAELFLARARGLEGFEKLWVLKRMLPHSVSDDSLVSLFLNEARIAAQLEHPNVVHVSDIGFAGDSHYFAMEHVHGADLRRVFDAARSSGGLGIDAALTIVIGVCSGLQHAHNKRGPDGHALGIVHRDVSLSNVLVSFDGAVKLADFGIAHVAGHGDRKDGGLLRGKAGYMSPEQSRGEALDRRSDVFALGIVLWELTTGHRMFGEQDPDATMGRISRGDVPSPRSVVPDFPEGLEAIVMKALAHDADARFADAEDLQLALEAYAREGKIAISAVTVARRMRVLFAGEVARWTEAENKGQTLAEHLTRSLTLQPSEVRSAPGPSLPVFVSTGPGATRSSQATRSGKGWPLAAIVVCIVGMSWGAFRVFGKDAMRHMAEAPLQAAHAAKPVVLPTQRASNTDAASDRITPQAPLHAAAPTTDEKRERTTPSRSIAKPAAKRRSAPAASRDEPPTAPPTPVVMPASAPAPVAPIPQAARRWDKDAPFAE